nr:MAG TPA: hypothetical protein [Caudoviricetes sp.]
MLRVGWVAPSTTNQYHVEQKSLSLKQLPTILEILGF